MVVKILPNDSDKPPGKLADAELHFEEGALAGLKLVGFAVWARRGTSKRNVTFPARQYLMNGERRSFSLLRPVAELAPQDRLRALVLEAYDAWRAGTAPPASPASPGQHDGGPAGAASPAEAPAGSAEARERQLLHV